MKKRISVEKLEELIKKNFPKVWLKPGSHMEHPDDNLISGEGATHKGLPVFDYWNEDYTETTYRMKVLVEFADFVESYDYYVEFIDAGTVAIAPN